MQIFLWLKNSFLEEKNYWILWVPIIFGAGIIFYFSYFENSSYTLPLLLFYTSAALAIFLRKELLFLILISITLFTGGFLWGKFYSEILIHTKQITHPLYVNAVGKVESVMPYENSLKGQTAYHLLLNNVQLQKVDYSKIPAKEKKFKPKKPRKKKIKKPKIVKKKSADEVKIMPSSIDDALHTNNEIKDSGDAINVIKKPRKKRRTKAEMLEARALKALQPAKPKKPKTKIVKKKSKKDSKTVIRNYINLASYQDIDRELQALSHAYPKGEWQGNKYANPPQKISVTVNKNDFNIGDIVTARVFLQPYKKPNILGGYDFGRDAYFKGIGANGKVIGEIKILKKAKINEFNEWINNLRQKIAGKISAQQRPDQASIAIALTVGYQNYISKPLMNDIRNSGLAHLLSISGLHLTLACGIFFFLLRFLLSCSNYLALNFDIKKIAAATAIIAGLSYLLLAGAPVPAVRSFIMVGLIFLAILFDQNPNPQRSIAFAALAILFLSPDSILSISFQLSFAAILALITLYQFLAKSSFTSNSRPIYIKFICYFLGIIFSSIAAEIATAPFSIYHFNNYVQYGVIANLIAIPIASFLVMPLVFLSLFLMPIGLEKLALWPMQFSIDLIIKISNYVANIPYSHHIIKITPPESLGLVVLGGLWFCIWQKNWRWLGILPIIFGAYLAYKNPLPDLLIDGDKKYFAIYNPKKDELIFSKKTRESMQIKDWKKKMGVNNYRNIFDLSKEELNEKQIFCNKEYCQLNLYNHKILVLTARNKINFLCENNSEILINLTKYQLPECSKNKVVINNYNLFKKGSHFLYLQKTPLVIKTVN